MKIEVAKIRVWAVLAVILCGLSLPKDLSAQRRVRPGAMKHTEAEVANKRKVTNLSCKYIRDGSIFEGPVYMTGDAGGIKIGEGAIIFSNGKYKLSFDAQKFKIKKYPVMTDKQLLEKGISKYEYENSWEYKKLGEDFEYGGKYTTIEQYGQKWLILYNGNSESVFAKIPINSINDNSFELEEDDMLVQMKLVK